MAASARPWSLAESDLLVDLSAKELRLTDIAAGLSRTVAECRTHLESLDLQKAKQQQQQPQSIAVTTPSRPQQVAIVDLTVDDGDALADVAKGRKMKGDATNARERAAAIPWTLTDDLQLVEYVATHGPAWTLLHNRYLPTRTTRSMQRRWALIEGLMVNASAAACLAGAGSPMTRLPSTTASSSSGSPSPSGTVSMEQVLRQYHAMTSAGSSSQNAVARGGSETHRRVALAFTGNAFPATSPAGLGSSPASATSQYASSPSIVSGATTLSSRAAAVGARASSSLGSYSPSPIIDSPPLPPSPRHRPVKRPMPESESVLGDYNMVRPITLDNIPKDLTGEELVGLVKGFVEAHAVQSEDEHLPRRRPQPRPMSEVTAAKDREARNRAAAAASVESVFAHLEMHRPQDQLDRVALELSQRHMANIDPDAVSNAAPITPHYVRDMECLVDGEVVPPPTATSPEYPDPRRRHTRLRQPESDEIQAMVAMHIHQTVEASSIGSSLTSTPYMPRASPAQQAAAAAAAANPAAWEEDHAAAAARASAAAFFASWANLEVSGALHNPTWSNVFEPQRCALRSMPRMMAFLPCVYLTLTGAQQSAAVASRSPMAVDDGVAGGGVRAASLCPIHVVSQLQTFAADMLAALPSLPRPWAAAAAASIGEQHARQED
jgi:hypothetical protein